MFLITPSKSSKLRQRLVCFIGIQIKSLLMKIGSIGNKIYKKVSISEKTEYGVKVSVHGRKKST